jgi:hypothetical protein
VVFEPLGPLAVGALVVATAPGAAPARYVRARPRASPPAVLDVAPHLAEIPANTLRLHLRFSEPMAGGPGIFDRILLEDAEGRRIDGAFRRTERWSPDRRALTLLFHPGRIKRDIPFAGGMEPLLVPGETVRLVIEGLTDAEGEAMGAPFVRSFVVGPPDAAGPPLSAVSAALSAEGVLRVDFSEPIDAVVAPAALRVRVGEEAHPCAWRVLPSEQTIVCALPERRPDAPVEVEVTCDLEDLAGNRPARPFDAPAGAARPCRPLRMSVPGHARLARGKDGTRWKRAGYPRD